MDSIIFPFSDTWWLYGAFIAFVLAMLALDLGVFHGKAHIVKVKEALGWSIFWIALALVFSVALYYMVLHRLQGPPATAALTTVSTSDEAWRISLEFLTGFIIEKTLAIDNIFVFAMIFSAFAIPPIYQHRVLFYGILGAIIFRAIFIALGAYLMAYHWVMVIFGIFLIFTGIKMIIPHSTPNDPGQSWAIKLLKRIIPITDHLDGEHFFTRKGGAIYATPLFVALFFLEATDIIFAFDSVPAIFAVTDEPFIVFTSNILALLGLRSLYFVLSGALHRFTLIKYGLALVLVFVGLKMAWLNSLMGGKFPIGWSLLIICALIGGTIVASLLRTSQNRQ